MSTNLMQASHQWASRPDDERFISLLDMQDHFDAERQYSREVIVPSRKIEVAPESDNKGLLVQGPNGHGYAPTNWAFGQLASLAGAPAGYLRSLPSPLAADCVNYGLQYKRDVEDVGVLLYRNGSPVLRAATGPRYGRIWNGEIVSALVRQFGDGLSGSFRVPGEFKERVEITKKNTTLYASDRDMFVFLADEDNRIEIPNRRNGEAGSLARGFFVWNSEVGSKTFGLATFLFDFVCQNRIVWGAEEYAELKIRHSVSAPVRFLEEIKPALDRYSQSSTTSIVNAVQEARKARIDNVDEFLAKRFSRNMVQVIKKAHELDEARPIETLWDATTAITAYARQIEHQDERVELEREAGEIMKLAA